ncbi:MAG: M28 family peptidase [Bryobacterales bacterium]|nr:M28 family peptidase [Bryobacterales bacterium]
MCALHRRRPRFARRFGLASGMLLCWGLVFSTGEAWGQAGGAKDPPAEYVLAGQAALNWTRRFVELGPRPAGSSALATQTATMAEALGEMSCTVEINEFVAATPVGALPMRNVIARFGPPSPDKVVVVSGHYDTLRKEGFLGANDGGSSAGLLMALAERLDACVPGPVWIVFFDGEEATVAWRGLDNTYGSRHLANKWADDGTLEKIRALINVDMIGDSDLQLVYEGNSDPSLREAVWKLAGELGYRDAFPREVGYISDDHIPFRRLGVRSLNLIDFTFGPDNSYWHTDEDTLDKLHARSFATVLHVVEAAVSRLLAD